MRYSIILPHCHAAGPTKLQRQEIDLTVSGLDCEVLAKFSGCPTVEHAIVAGLRAARGEAVAVIDPADRYPLGQLPALLRGLSRADFVCGRRRRRGWPKLAERIARLPRWLVLGLDTRDPGCLFWAARREVFNGLQLVPRLIRHLPALVARQGFRVDNFYVAERAALRMAGTALADTTVPGTTAAEAVAPVPHVAPASLLSAWWTCRKLRRDAAAPISLPASHIDPVNVSAATEPYRAKSA